MLKQAIRILFEANNAKKLVTREIVTFKELLNKLDNPQNSFNSIHITGTNGKGSVALKTAYILQKAGYKTGLYTSPHIFSFLQRIKINRENIREQKFCQNILKIHDIAKNNNLDITFFEYLTACGFLQFKEEKCDFASIQVGLGGRYDTTNVIIPQVSIITSIGIDHQKILGNTREEIAKDKAGIIKQNKPVVIGPFADLPPIIQQAKMKKAPLYKVEQSRINDFEEENNQVTRQAVTILRNQGFKISDSNIEHGLLIKQSCRMQQLPLNLRPEYASHKRIFFDVGHNPNAVQRMLEYYKKNIKKQGDKLIVVFGASKDKNVMSSLKKIQEQADMIFLVKAQHFRAMSIQEISEYVGYSKYPHKFRVLDDGKISTNMQVVCAQKKHKNILVCGSFFIMPQAWGFFDKKYLNEQFNIQQQYILQNNTR